LDHPRNFIGRDRGVQVFVDDPYASGKHASIRCEKVSGSPRGEFVLRDLDSENGTYVNGQRISGDTVLEDGNVIRVGETELVFKRIERKP
jgi:pSer/pThr/pTyr-binding forkhead associated (FHA) protein